MERCRARASNAYGDLLAEGWWVELATWMLDGADRRVAELIASVDSCR